MKSEQTIEMGLQEFLRLREKIQELIHNNHSLRLEKRAFAEKLRLRERQIEELKERHVRSEALRKEVYKRINSILEKLETLRLS